MNDVPLEKQQIGEKYWLEAMKFLFTFGWDIQQIDWLGEKDGKWVKFEVKAQEPFEPPPFKGHGLPRWQIDKSMKLLKDKQIRTYLMIRDLKDEKWIGAFLDELERGFHHDTFGAKPRRIYPIEKFELVGESIVFN